MIYNVIDFGAVADGETLCTKAGQKAIDVCHKNGGGIVEFAAGKYVIGTIFLKSNVHIRIAEGAEIFGSLNFYDYAQQEKILFYLWGHSYEFDNDGNWQLIEDFCAFIGGREDVWYATNGEIYEYVQAYNSLQYSADGHLVKNPTSVDVYIHYFGKPYIIPAGKTVLLEKDC